MEIWQFIILAVIFFTTFFIGTAWLVVTFVAWAGKRHAEKLQNECVEKICKLLPGKNCGECGYEICEEYAKAVFYGRVDEDRCIRGKEDLPENIKKEVDAFMAFLENGETIDEVKKAEKERRFQSK